LAALECPLWVDCSHSHSRARDQGRAASGGKAPAGDTCAPVGGGL